MHQTDHLQGVILVQFIPVKGKTNHALTEVLSCDLWHTDVICFLKEFLLAASLYRAYVDFHTDLLPNANPMCWSVCRSVGWSVRRVYCGKTADWIWMPFRVMSGVSRGMGVLDRDGDRQRVRCSFGVNVGHPIVTNGDCGVVILCCEGWRRVSSQITLGFLVSFTSVGL